MLALYRSGRQADALEVYRTVRGRLNDELGLQPGQELRDLEAAILRQDDALSLPALAPVPAPTPSATPAAEAVPAQRRRRFVAIGALAALAAVAVAVTVLLLRDEPEPIVVPPNSVAAIDPATNRVIPESILQTGIEPGPVTGGAGSIWVGNLEGRSLTRIDPSTNEVVSTIPLPATPDAITFGRGALWAVSGRLGAVYRVDPEFESPSEPIPLGQRSIRYARAGVDVGEGSVWAAYGDSTLGKVDPEAPEEGESTSTSAGRGHAALVVAWGFVWVASSGDDTVQRFEPGTYDLGPVGRALTVGRAPSGIGAGYGAIWVACTDDDYVARIPADRGFASAPPIPVGEGPTSVAVGAGAVWVANAAGGTVSRIDPETYEVVETIEVGNAPAGIAVSGGQVWVSVKAPSGTTP
jgi:YVTN family beta-propeller protein